jgi:hypothetical protein
MTQTEHNDGLLQEIDTFKRQRGLYSNNHPVEMKWGKVEKEWKEVEKFNRTSRYLDFVDIFLQALQNHRLSFGCLYLPKDDYMRVEKDFLCQHPGCAHNYFFMLYFMFLYHCFIKNQVKQNPCEIWIDNRNMGAQGRTYDIETLRNSLNSKLYREYIPKNQLPLSIIFNKEKANSVQLVNLTESDQNPLVQLADVCAGCFRYILENRVEPPIENKQLSFINMDTDDIPTEQLCGKEVLARYFYTGLRKISDYKTINLLQPSYHHRFNIFPFTFSGKL